jgi:hypothetical protein
MNYDHRKLISKWGVFLAYLFGLEHGAWRAYNDTRQSVGIKRMKPAAIWRGAA